MPRERQEFVVAAHEKVVGEPQGASNWEQSRPDLNIVAGQQVTGQHILDVGCGPAVDVGYLTVGNQVVGLDLSPRSLAWAGQRGLQVLVGDAEGLLPFGDGCFDIVVVKDVFEHLLDPTSLLGEAYRVLKHGGTLVANVPNHFFFWGRLRMVLGKGLMWKTVFGDHTCFYEEWNYQHVRFFTWAGFQKFLAQVEFARIEYVWEFGELLYHPKQAILERLERDEFSLRHLSPILRPMVHVFFAIFPKRLRVALARWRPGFFSASFYARCVKP